MEKENTKPFIVVVSTNFWNSPYWTRKQRFAQYLSCEGYNVLYVNPPVFFTNRSISFYDKENIPSEDLIKVSDSLYVLVSKLYVPAKFSNIPFFEKLRFYFHYANIKKAIKDLKWDSVGIHWAYYPQSILFKGALEESIYLFDWVDRFDSYPHVNKDFIYNLEKATIHRADLVLNTAKGLYKEASAVNKGAYFISNGVDYDLFQKESKEVSIFKNRGIDLKRWKDLAVFVGAIHSWIDLELVEYVAKNLPDILFVMAGPVKQDISNLKILKNVIFLGAVPKEDIPFLLKESSVCINPFKKNRLSYYVNPLKVYEYLAAGCPVVSVSMPELLSLPPIFSFADSKEDFLEAIRFEIKNSSSEVVRKRKELALKFDWKSLQRDVKDILDGLKL